MFIACEKDDDESNDAAAAPVFSSFELGYEDSHTAYQGSDLHLDAAIVAEGKIATIHLGIHPEGEHKSGGEWEFDSTYTAKYAGAINVDFHEHVDIPADADTGHYHFHLMVTDEAGQRSEKEAELHITLPTDETAPQVSISSAPTSGQSFSNGDTIRISGQVTDDYGIGGLYVGLVGQGQGLSDADVTHVNTISLLHTHSFTNPKAVDFEAFIVVGSARDNDHPETKEVDWQSGNYYLLVKSPGKYGGGAGFSEQYPITITIE
jgi:hypothetical protein